ncbi:MAG: adenylyltransferase/cytidyltransferase family protein [Gammaproteobacteria bacterium]
MTDQKRIMADMSATLIHHGHIRLLKKAAQLGKVIVALTTDEEIKKHKGYVPELSWNSRREILESVRYVDEVVPSPWILDDEFLDIHSVDLLVHGGESANLVKGKRLLLFPYTDGVSSRELRAKARDILTKLEKSG